MISKEWSGCIPRKEFTICQKGFSDTTRNTVADLEVPDSRCRNQNRDFKSPVNKDSHKKTIT